MCVIYILSYVCMFYKFIWYNILFWAWSSHTHSCGFPLRNYRLKDAKSTKRVKERQRQFKSETEKGSEKKNDQKWDFFLLHFSSFFLKSKLNEESGWNEMLKSIWVWARARSRPDTNTNTYMYVYKISHMKLNSINAHQTEFDGYKL